MSLCYPYIPLYSYLLLHLCIFYLFIALKVPRVLKPNSEVGYVPFTKFTIISVIMYIKFFTEKNFSNFYVIADRTKCLEPSKNSI